MPAMCSPATSFSSTGRSGGRCPVALQPGGCVPALVCPAQCMLKVLNLCKHSVEKYQSCQTGPFCVILLKRRNLYFIENLSAPFLMEI